MHFLIITKNIKSYHSGSCHFFRIHFDTDTHMIPMYSHIQHYSQYSWWLFYYHYIHRCPHHSQLQCIHPDRYSHRHCDIPLYTLYIVCMILGNSHPSVDNHILSYNTFIVYSEDMDYLKCINIQS